MKESPHAHCLGAAHMKKEVHSITGGKIPPVSRTIDSQTLLQSHSTLLISHQGELYRLQLTRQGKLILTK